MFDEFKAVALQIYEDALSEGRLTRNPTNEELYKMACEEPDVKVTRYGSIAADSEPFSRAAMFTKNNIDHQFGDDERELLRLCKESLAKEELVNIDVKVGDREATARLIIPKRFAHMPYGGQKLFGRAEGITDPTYTIIMFYDEWHEKNRGTPLPKKTNVTIRNCHSDKGGLVKIARNTNYLGEWKKGLFTGEDWRAKLDGNGMFLHAGCRMDYLEMSEGDYGTQTSLFIALSANGKTSTTCKVLARKHQEQSWLIQDDGGILKRDGSFIGFELGGLFIKTDGLSPANQIESYYATLKPGAYLENVGITEDGDIDFFDITRTSNGRAIVERRDFMHCSKDINAAKVDNIFLITRGPIVPAIAKLNAEQAAAFMVLGQSMESSAGDPTQAGKIKNEFFYDPFVAGDRTAHANLFYDLLRDNPQINCYLLNTGHIGYGQDMHDITLADTMGILDSVIRGGVTNWIESEATGLSVPKSIRLVDNILLHPERVFVPDSFAKLQQELDTQRAAVLDKYPGLDKRVRAVFIK